MKRGGTRRKRSKMSRNTNKKWNAYSTSRMSKQYDLLGLLRGHPDPKELTALDAWTQRNDVSFHFTSPYSYTERDQKIRDVLVWGIDKQWKFNKELNRIDPTATVLSDDDAPPISVTIDIKKMMDFLKMYGSNRELSRKAFVNDAKKIGAITVDVYKNLQGRKPAPHEPIMMVFWFFSEMAATGEYEHLRLNINRRYAELLSKGKLVDISLYIHRRGKAFSFMRMMVLQKIKANTKQGYPIYYDTVYLDEIAIELYGDENKLSGRHPESIDTDERKALIKETYIARKHFKKMLLGLNKEGVLPPYKLDVKNNRIITDKKELAKQVKAANIQRQIQQGKDSK